MGYRDYFDDKHKEPTGLSGQWILFKNWWKGFWYKWIDLGMSTDNNIVGYYRFRTWRVINIVLFIVLILALRII